LDVQLIDCKLIDLPKSDAMSLSTGLKEPDSRLMSGPDAANVFVEISATRPETQTRLFA
jgi:hypothetical protein